MFDDNFIQCSFDEEQTWTTISLISWAQECAEFFTAAEVFPPFDISCKYAAKNPEKLSYYGCDFYFFWKSFKLTNDSYLKILDFFLYQQIIYSIKYYPPDRAISNINELTSWRLEKNLGIPFDDMMRLFNKREEISQKEKTIGINLDIWNEHNNITNKIDNLILKYKTRYGAH